MLIVTTTLGNRVTFQFLCKETSRESNHKQRRVIQFEVEVTLRYFKPAHAIHGTGLVQVGVTYG